MSKTTNVLVLGATGRTGRSIVDGLIEYGGYKIFAGIRPASMNGSAAVGLQAKGVELRTLDLDDLSDSSLTSALEGIQVVVSAVTAMNLKAQIPVIEAAKKAGVERFIPSDFGTAGQKGTMDLLDQKLEIRDHIKQVGIGYTFVDVGWWTQLLLPVLKPSQDLFGLPPFMKSFFECSFGDGSHKSAITSLNDVGRYIARIINDPRTLNKYVFCWNDEVTSSEYQAVVREVSGTQVQFPHVSDEEVQKRFETAKAEKSFLAIMWKYAQRVWILGDNTVSNAVKPEFGSALDSRQLYPDFKPQTIQEVAKEYYSR